MSDVREHDGQSYVLRGGAYKRATAVEAEILRGDQRAVAIKSALADIYGLGNLALGAVFAQPELGGMGNASSERAFTRAAEHAQTGAQIHALRPGASQQGGALLDLLALTPVARGVRGSTAGQRVRQALTGTNPAQQGADAAVDAAFNGSTVGAAQTGRVKGMGKLYRMVGEKLDSPRSLSADQFEILESGLYKEVGFSFPPGSLNSEQMYASFLSNPFTRAVIEPALRANSATLGNRFISAIGLDPADFPRGVGRGVLSAARQHFSAAFGRVAKAIGPGRDLSEIAADITPLLTISRRQQLEAAGNIVGGKQLMNIRSKLNASLARAWRGTDEALINRLENAIDFIDQDIGKALAGTDTLPFWRQTQEEYRTFLVTRRPGVISRDTGELSLKTLTGNLEKQYVDFFEAAPGEISAIKLRKESTRELLKFARVARSFTDSLADSGTATRSTLQQLATNPKASLQMKVLSGVLEDGTFTPQRALELSR